MAKKKKTEQWDFKIPKSATPKGLERKSALPPSKKSLKKLNLARLRRGKTESLKLDIKSMASKVSRTKRYNHERKIEQRKKSPERSKVNVTSKRVYAGFIDIGLLCIIFFGVELNLEFIMNWIIEIRLDQLFLSTGAKLKGIYVKCIATLMGHLFLYYLGNYLFF